jgi:hypothetical protein
LDALRESRYSLKVPVVVHRNCDVLLRTKISFRRLDRGVAEEKFDLLQVAAVLAAQLRTGPPQMSRCTQFGSSALSVQIKAEVFCYQ